MEISTKGIELIKKWEGVRLEAYEDIIGVWTIGYGHTKDVKKGMKITQQQAEDFLKEDIHHHVAYMKEAVTVPLTQEQFDALASFHFNLGAQILKDSDLLTYINKKEWKKAAGEMQRYVYAGKEKSQGLINRRNDEAKLFLSTLEDKTKTSSSELTTSSTTTPKETTTSAASVQETTEPTSTMESASTVSSDTSTESEPTSVPVDDQLTAVELIKKAYEKFFS